MPEPATLAGARTAQAALDDWLAGIDPVDPATPSRLPGWSVGHVLTHLARNADSHVRMLAGIAQYPGGVAQRDGDIAAGAGRGWPELLADLVAAHAALEAAWRSVGDWSSHVEHGAGTRALAEVPFLRWREVELHRVDLGLGYTFADMPTEYVRRDLAALTMRHRASKPIGMTELPAEVIRASPPLRLAWLTGRAEIDGVGPAGIF